MKKRYKIALIGATGLVGRELLTLLEDFPIKELHCFASKKNVVIFKGKKKVVEPLEEKLTDNFDIVFFATSSKISKKFIPSFLKSNTKIIDLSSAFRMKKPIPLIIPEINGDILKKDDKLIASPNCTTTIMLMAIAPLHRKFKLKRVIASTYQAASGGGKALLEKLKKDTKDHNKKARSYGFNLFLHDSPMNDKRYCQEEMKMILESCKILNEKIDISATCVRVPTIRSHAISLNVEFFRFPSIKDVYSILQNTPNLTLFDEKGFATPLITNCKKEVFCSRIRRDITNKNAIELWVVSDQLLKGAALNAYQIAKELVDRSFI